MSARPNTSTSAPNGQGSPSKARGREAALPGGMDAPALDAEILVRRGAFVLDAHLRVQPGEIVALLGPNGSGKSTFLHAVAGLLPLEFGTVTAAGRVLSRRDPRSETNDAEPGARRPSVQVEPEHREIGLLGQDPLLFPHLSALENVAFGRRAQGVAKAAARQEALAWLHAVQIPELSERRPAQLSGGQQQRVAIARALAAGPSLLLLDEPMAALDVQSAPQIRLLLREQLRESGTTTILVTHDVIDAIVLADRIVILDEGRIVDQGLTAEVLARPRNHFVADLVGVNLVTGVDDPGAATDVVASESDIVMRLPGGRALVGRAAAQRVRTRNGPGGEVTAQVPVTAGGALHAVFRPAAVRIEPSGAATEKLLSGPAAGALSSAAAESQPERIVSNRWTATLVSLEPASGGIRVRTDDPAGIVADMPAVDAAGLGLEPGSRIQLSIAVADVVIHSAAP